MSRVRGQWIKIKKSLRVRGFLLYQLNRILAVGQGDQILRAKGEEFDQKLRVIKGGEILGKLP